MVYQSTELVTDTRDRAGDSAAPYPDQFGYSVLDEAFSETSRMITIKVVPGPMTGDFRVAIAEFTADDGVDTDSDRLAQTVFELILDQLTE